MGIDLLVKLLPEPSQDAVHRGTSALAAMLMALVAYKAIQVAISTWDQLMPTIDVTSAMFYIAVIVGSIHSVLHLAYMMWTGAYTFKDETE